MTAKKNKQASSNHHADIWIISKGRASQFDLSHIEKSTSTEAVKEYRISDIARYLLNPNPIEVDKRLAGCEIHYSQRTSKKIKEKIRRSLPHRLRRLLNDDAIRPEILISRCKLKIPPIKDKDLRSHLKKIYESIRSYDSILKKLPQLDPRKISHLIGICEDIGGNLSYLKLQGGIEEKIRYLRNYILKDVGVLLRKAYIAEGLFELRGFNFASYNASQAHRLISYLKNGEPKLCVLNSNNKVEYWIDDPQLLKYMLLLEQSIKADSNLKDAFHLCLKNQANPVKLFFNRQLEIDYSKAPFPQIFREIFRNYKVEINPRNLVKPSLNYLQIGISFNYIPLSDSAEDRLITLISVMHDLRALESLKKNLPLVYAEITKRAFISEVGCFYLLDSIEGQSNG